MEHLQEQMQTLPTSQKTLETDVVRLRSVADGTWTAPVVEALQASVIVMNVLAKRYSTASAVLAASDSESRSQAALKSGTNGPESSRNSDHVHTYLT